MREFCIVPHVPKELQEHPARRETNVKIPALIFALNFRAFCLGSPDAGISMRSFQIPLQTRSGCANTGALAWAPDCFVMDSYKDP